MRAVDHAIERFPDHAEAVRRLYLSDERFRAICEDLSLALSSLHHFERHPDAGRRPEIDDFREVLRELEAEMRSHLNAALGG
ncbi:hypothetical protein PVT71_10775 [Salipiger sp. H15]|uniref:Uncharacterized protein n=1 Tax=Alloyangia sp. H15 TaxID=3029062 RepID=A0AAU8AEV5_9RHOB